MVMRNSDKHLAQTKNISPKRNVAPRRAGRPTGAASGAEKRNRLLDIALTLFARQGIVDTTLAAIAREAGVTPAMVHYYFDTRDQLLDVLIEERLLPVRTSLGGVFEANANDPVAAITQLTQRFIDIAIEYPWFAPLWMREVISESGLLRQRMQERYGDAHQKSIRQCIERWQAEGLLNADIEPSLLFVSLLGLTILPLAVGKIWRNDPTKKQLGAKEIAQHAIALLVHGVRPQTSASKKR